MDNLNYFYIYLLPYYKHEMTYSQFVLTPFSIVLGYLIKSILFYKSNWKDKCLDRSKIDLNEKQILEVEEFLFSLLSIAKLSVFYSNSMLKKSISSSSLLIQDFLLPMIDQIRESVFSYKDVTLLQIDIEQLLQNNNQSAFYAYLQDLSIKILNHEGEQRFNKEWKHYFNSQEELDNSIHFIPMDSYLFPILDSITDTYYRYNETIESLYYEICCHFLSVYSYLSQQYIQHYILSSTELEQLSPSFYLLKTIYKTFISSEEQVLNSKDMDCIQYYPLYISFYSLYH